MRDIDAIANDAELAGVRLRANEEGLLLAATRFEEALFQVPLLALCTLLVARGSRPELRVADLSLWVSVTLGSHFIGAGGAIPRLKWSVQFRRRCAEALVFLENIELVAVTGEPIRTIRVTPAGLAFLRDLSRQTEGTAALVLGLERSLRKAQQKGVSLL